MTLLSVISAIVAFSLPICQGKPPLAVAAISLRLRESENDPR